MKVLSVVFLLIFLTLLGVNGVHADIVALSDQDQAALVGAGECDQYGPCTTGCFGYVYQVAGSTVWQCTGPPCVLGSTKVRCTYYYHELPGCEEYYDTTESTGYDDCS